jgi:putative FmdB family regulatory protein
MKIFLFFNYLRKVYMPTYEYQCKKCLQKIDVFQKITDDPLKRCPKCSETTLVRGPGGGIGLSFIGSGWYKTDYSSKAPKEDSSNAKDECCPCGKNQTACSAEN